MADQPKTVRILNRAHTSLTLTEPAPDQEHLGNAPPLRSAVLAGNGAVTEVDADTYNAWKAGNPYHALLGNNMLEEVGEDYEAPDEVFGFEPGLEAAATDPEAVKLAEAGVVTETEPGGLTSRDMTPDNGTLPSDDGGEPRHASQPDEPEPARREGAPVVEPPAAAEARDEETK